MDKSIEEELIEKTNRLNKAIEVYNQQKNEINALKKERNDLKRELEEQQNKIGSLMNRIDELEHRIEDGVKQDEDAFMNLLKENTELKENITKSSMECESLKNKQIEVNEKINNIFDIVTNIKSLLNE